MGAKASKLTDKDVRWIRMPHNPKISMNKMARMFGVSLVHIRDILIGNRRRGVSDTP